MSNWDWTFNPKTVITSFVSIHIWTELILSIFLDRKKDSTTLFVYDFFENKNFFTITFVFQKFNPFSFNYQHHNDIWFWSLSTTGNTRMLNAFQSLCLPFFLCFFLRGESKLVSSSSLFNNADKSRTGPFFGKIGVAFMKLCFKYSFSPTMSELFLGAESTFSEWCWLFGQKIWFSKECLCHFVMDSG